MSSERPPIDRRLLDILCCPISHDPVQPLSSRQLDALNAAIAAGEVQTVEGVAVKQALAAGLITRDGKRIYAVDDGIPVMLADEAIGTLQLKDFPA